MSDYFDLSPLWISLETAAATIVIVFFLGVLAAWWVERLPSESFKIFVDGIFTLPMVLPPTVAGFFLLVVFGNNRIVGRFFIDNFGIQTDALPLHNITQIVCGNACRLDWESVCPHTADEEVFVFVLPGETILSDRIAELKKKLSDTDYAVIKIAEGAATAEEYAEVITNRQKWREEINALEA